MYKSIYRNHINELVIIVSRIYDIAVLFSITLIYYMTSSQSAEVFTIRGAA